MEPFLGQILAVGFNFAPVGWATCNGQVLSIAQNSALFALLGTTYGGNGINTFGLPDLRGRAPISFGQGPGLQNYNLGQMAGVESSTLLASNLPAHTHMVATPVNTATTAGVTSPQTAYLAADVVTAPHGTTAQAVTSYASSSTAGATLAPYPTAPAGNGLPLSILQPYNTLNFIIALQGIFPPRP